MLLTKEVEINLNSANIKYYEQLGYKIPRYKNKHGKFTVSRGTKILIKIKDIQLGSGSLINAKCDGDNCENSYLVMKWCDYLRYVKDNEKIYCSKCAKKLFAGKSYSKTILEKGISFEQWCIENNRQDVLDRWDYNLNNCKPDEINHGTNVKYYFKCNKDIHESELKYIKSFTMQNKNSINCKACNSFAQYLIDTYGDSALDLYWSNKNTVSPWDISKCSTIKIYIKCKKNQIHDDYLISCQNFLKGHRCKNCSDEMTESLLQNKIRLYLNYLGFNILHESNCTLNPINTIEHISIKVKGILRYDNEIILSNEKHIFIEVNGVQHYKITGFHRKQSKSYNTTSEYELEYQKAKDEYKKQYVLERGHYFLEIPYYTDNKEETWKKLIDEKIQEIQELDYIL